MTTILLAIIVIFYFDTSWFIKIALALSLGIDIINALDKINNK